MTVGVLAVHGDFSEHRSVLASLDVESREIRTLEDLAPLTHLIIPGGESTVMGGFLERTGMGKRIQKRVAEGSLAVFGTCAGAILLTKKITGKLPPHSLKLLDATIERNAYGTQHQSFEASITVLVVRPKITVAFIRAPRFTKMGKSVSVLAKHNGDPILVRQGRILASTFHPEVTGETAIHALFLKL
ncbi:MAG: pyridoxal 5'-phosphate synthase glutaminase subunit PdxT [Candidatus Peregrinibacteria bacterium]|nr:pyridoxal 5'-phosphate synthase glutaminase subunit PdxT [Candidatus Peregrinibacteria bacterium]